MGKGHRGHGKCEEKLSGSAVREADTLRMNCQADAV